MGSPTKLAHLYTTPSIHLFEEKKSQRSKMAFPRYKTYCFYTTVKTGTVKLAIFFLFCGGCTIISSSVGLVNYTPINEDQINQVKVNSTEDTLKTNEEIDFGPLWRKIGEKLDKFWFVVQIVSSAINILLNGSMLYGVTQKKAGFMLPWLIFGMIGIVLSTALLVFGSGLFGYFFSNDIFGTPVGIFNAVIFVILASFFVGVVVYHWLVVRSAYMDIRESPVLPVYVDDNVDDDTKIEKAGGKYIRM